MFLILNLKIHEDFVLITGDTVSNMSLTQELQEHKDRREKDNNAVMTMIIKTVKAFSDYSSISTWYK